jgi:hypothetical protein
MKNIYIENDEEWIKLNRNEYKDAAIRSRMKNVFGRKRGGHVYLVWVDTKHYGIHWEVRKGYTADEESPAGFREESTEEVLPYLTDKGKKRILIEFGPSII